MVAPVSVEPTDDLFAVPDKDFDVPLARSAPAHMADLSAIAEENPDLAGDLQLEDDFQQPVPASVAVQAPTPVPVEPVADAPEVIDIDGGTVTIQKEKSGYKATLESEEGGGKEVFRAKTRNELLTNVLAAKLQATQQIRRLNKKLKTGVIVDAPTPVPVQESVISPRQLTTDEVFEIKNTLASDPDKAFDLRFQKKYGMTEADFVSLVNTLKSQAKRGQEAYEELTIEGVSKEFLERNSEVYYPYESNGSNLMAWLCKNKLHRNLTKQDNFGSLSAELLAKGLYTVENLEEAMEDLRDSGLLEPPPVAEPVQEPVAPPVPPAPVAPVQQPVPQNPRIVAQRRQARGGLGIRASQVSNVAPEPETAPSVDDLENLSTEQINELFSGVRRAALQNPNRRSR